MMDISEKRFEETIEQALLASKSETRANGISVVREPNEAYGVSAPTGYRKGKLEDYDRALCLDTRAVIDFIYATQPQEWDKFKKYYGAEARGKFSKRLASEISKRGTLDVLRKGIKDSGCKFQMAYFRPSSGINETLQKLYAANVFVATRQLQYSEKDSKSLDMVIFLNGLPIFTAELKNPLTGQNVQDSIHQYRFDRDHREPLFTFGRCLAHFAIDPDFVFVTTHLQGPKTQFLPFNQGKFGGAGNPPAMNGYSTAYLWEGIWSKGSVLNLIQHFIHAVEEEDDKGKKTGKRRLIFPRYHQLDAVRRLVAHAKEQGTGQRYLIQHSAGSGKSNSIAWLAHQLSVLHDAHDRRVFDSIVVVTDRRVLDRQIQRTVRQFEQTLGVVENIDKTSMQLKEALEAGKTIIVSTLQKYPVIAGEISSLPGKRFAIIIDEAHSSQSGESTKSLKQVLSAGTLEDAERQDQPGEDLEDLIVAEMKARGQVPNVSTFAFTATPKPKTLELFGVRKDGKYEAFSLYSMRQAIEEKFILDVFQNYTTYKVYWKLLKKIEQDPSYDRSKASYLLRSFVDLHEHAIAKKVEIMVEHFNSQIRNRIGGKAKAMIVTRSRLHAVRYKLAVDSYLAEKGYKFKALVAFSGTVRDGGIDYSEANMNGFSEKQTADTFKQDEYRILIVAYKFQTGFDQPLLHTMYVDQKLGGVHAVQTLSRLNRIYDGKEDTMVLDFVNSANDIQESFQPYYEKTILSEGTDPNSLYDLENKLEGFHFYSQEDVQNFALVYFNPKATQDLLYAALESTIDRFREANKEEQIDFRGTLTDYTRLYSFLSQIIPFADASLEKLYVFARLLPRRLPVKKEELPKEIQSNIDMDSYRIQKARNGRIPLERGEGKVAPIKPDGVHFIPTEQLEPLSQIIKELNERFGMGLTEEDKVFIQQLEEKLAKEEALQAAVRSNTRENARLTFNHVVGDRLQDMLETNFKLYKRITDDPEVGKYFMDLLFDRFLRDIEDK